MLLEKQRLVSSPPIKCKKLKCNVFELSKIYAKNFSKGCGRVLCIVWYWKLKITRRIYELEESLLGGPFPVLILLKKAVINTYAFKGPAIGHPNPVWTSKNPFQAFARLEMEPICWENWTNYFRPKGRWKALLLLSPQTPTQAVPYMELFQKTKGVPNHKRFKFQ